MTVKHFLVSRFGKFRWVQELNKAFLLNNLPLVDEILQKDLKLCAPVYREAPSRSKQPIAVLNLQARVIGEFMQANPKDNGYPVVDTEGIMYYYKDKIDELCDASGLTVEEQEEHLIYHIRSLASCVHLIPASGESHHRGLGGLFTHSIESAVFAARIAKDKLFQTDENDETIPKNRWVLGAILGALFHDLGKVIVNVNIYIDEPKREIFTPQTKELTPWLLERLSFGSKYHVQWITIGDEHKKRTQTMLYSRPIVINQKTLDWLGETVYTELTKFLENEPNSKYRNLLVAADTKSARGNLQHGQFQVIPGSTSEERELEMAFETIIQMLHYGEQCQNENGEPEEFEMNGLKLRGWSINTPKSAVVYKDVNHLYIFWKDFMQMRIDYEMGERSSTILKTSQKSCAVISGAEWDNEFSQLAQKLHDNNYLQTRLTSDTDKIRWEVRRIDQETGEIGGESHWAICFNSLGIKKIFKNRKRPPANPHLLSVMGVAPIETSMPHPETEKTQEAANEAVAQEPAADEAPKVEVASSMPHEDFQNSDPKGNPKPEKPKPEVKEKVIVGEGTHDGPPKKTFKDLEVRMDRGEYFEASLWEIESDEPSGMACIVRKGGKVQITAESVNELCKLHGCDINILKTTLPILLPYCDYLYFDGSGALVYKENRYYRKSKQAENVGN